MTIRDSKCMISPLIHVTQAAMGEGTWEKVHTCDANVCTRSQSRGGGETRV